jgi:cytosine/adenosine deaminase-related metal-dependent hydrolase
VLIAAGFDADELFDRIHDVQAGDDPPAPLTTRVAPLRRGEAAGVVVRVAPDCSSSDQHVDLTLTYRVGDLAPRTQHLVPTIGEGGDPFRALAAETCTTRSRP